MLCVQDTNPGDGLGGGGRLSVCERAERPVFVYWYMNKNVNLETIQLSLH